VDGGVAPLASILLRDGTTLQIAPDGVRAGDKVIELAKIQDARRVSPNPETIAFRVAGMGLLEYQPEREGDGATALEALYRLRPELRPAGFGVPAGAYPYPYPTYPGYPGYAGLPPAPPYDPNNPTGIVSAPGYPSYPPYPTYPYPPATGYAPVPTPEQRAAMQSLAERRFRGVLTPFPRRFGELLAAIYQLYASRLRIWLLLGLCVALLTGLLDGGASYLLSIIIQPNPSVSGQLSTTSCTFPYQFEAGNALIRDALIWGALLIVSVFATALQTAVMSNGARDAVLDRKISVKRSFGSGLRRFAPTLGASLLAGGAYYLALAPAAICFTIVFASTSGMNLCDTSNAATASGFVQLLTCLGSILGIIGITLAILFAVRLGLAPYAAATDRISVRQAMVRSWRITRGNFWRTFGVILLTGIMAWMVLFIASLFGAASPILSDFIATPIAYLFTVPFIAITYVTLLYDLRLRAEGYAALTQQEQREQQETPSDSQQSSTTSTPVPPLG
jgi:hypothetical protein